MPREPPLMYGVVEELIGATEESAILGVGGCPFSLCTHLPKRKIPGVLGFRYKNFSKTRSTELEINSDIASEDCPEDKPTLTDGVHKSPPAPSPQTAF